MQKHLLAAALLRAIAAVSLALPANAMAQTETATTSAGATASFDSADAATDLDSIVVTGEIAYRDRTDAIAPVLSYDLDYFQRFEPRTVGDMLKRVPSVGFISDVLEYDAARLRGL